MPELSLGFFEALSHWAFGDGTPAHVAFHAVDHGIEPGDFNSIQALALNHEAPGSVAVTARQPLEMKGLPEQDIYGHVWFVTEGVFTRHPDGSASYRGTLRAEPDVYDFNKAGHRSGFKELATNITDAVGSWVGARPYEVHFRGTVPFSGDFSESTPVSAPSGDRREEHKGDWTDLFGPAALEGDRTMMDVVG